MEPPTTYRTPRSLPISRGIGGGQGGGSGSRADEEALETAQLEGQVIGNALRQIQLVLIRTRSHREPGNGDRICAHRNLGLRVQSGWSNLKHVAIHHGIDAIDPHGLRYTLERPVTQVRELARRHAMYLIIERPGNFYRAGVGGGLNSRCNVDTVAAKIASDNHHIGDVQSEAHVDGCGSRNGGQAVTCLDSRPDCVHGAAKFSQNGVPRCPEDPAVVAYHDVLDDSQAIMDPCDGRLFVVLHCRRRTHEIGYEDCRQLTMHHCASDRQVAVRPECITSCLKRHRYLAAWKCR